MSRLAVADKRPVAPEETGLTITKNRPYTSTGSRCPTAAPCWADAPCWAEAWGEFAAWAFLMER